jgi:hypothetical protein
MLTLLLDLGPGEKGMTDSKAGSTIQKEDDLGCQEPEPGQEALEPIIQGSHLATE